MIENSLKGEISNKGVKGEMQNFGNHMETGTSNKHTWSKCRNRSEIEQKTKKVRHNGTKLQIHDMKRHK